jgi:hypothetical protein
MRAKINQDNIPAELRDMPQWVVWRFEDKGGPKPTKVPYDARELLRVKASGEEPAYIRAKPNNPATWTDFKTALEALHAFPTMDGVGFMMPVDVPEGAGLIGVDIDGCIDGGEIQEEAKRWLREFDTYSEITPSGKGLRIFCRGTLPKNCKAGGNEIYHRLRFLTLTGNRVPWTLTRTIEERQGAVDHFLRTYFADQLDRLKRASSAPRNITVTGVRADDDTVLKAALRSEKFRKLWGGDFSEVRRKDDGATPDYSTAVASFLPMLARHTRNPEQLDRLFRASGLYPHWEHKWDRLKDGEIETALDLTQEAWERDRLNNLPDISYMTAEAPEPPKKEPADGGENGPKDNGPKHGNDGPEPEPEPPGQSDPPDPKGKPTQAQRLIKLALANCELFRRDDQTPWVTVKINGHRENWPVDSPSFRRFLEALYWKAYGDAVGENGIKAACSILASQALDGPKHRVYLRTARTPDALYVDLGDERWRAVKVTADGWEVVDNPPVKFRRTANTGALPVPEQGGQGNTVLRLSQLLEPFLATTGENSLLFLGWLLDAFKGHGPYFVLTLHGPQGSAKSYVCRVLRSLVDPLNKAPLSCLPRDERDLGVDAQSELVLAYDNVSYLPLWLSDALCRVATGGGLKTRALYTNDEQQIFDVCNPIALNGIPDYAEAADLLSRSLIVQQPQIGDKRRKDEKELDAHFQQVRPAMFGALLDLLSAGLRNLSGFSLLTPPRMADSARWVTACLGDDTFLKALEANISTGVEAGLEASPIYEGLEKALDEAGGQWTGTAAELLRDVKRLSQYDQERAKNFPRTPRAMGNQLRRDLPALHKLGWTISEGRSNGQRVWRIETPLPR